MTDREKPALKFSLSELAGAFGDFGTIIPLILAVALVTTMNVGYMLLFFGIWFLVTGWYYGLPIPIEPMKVIAVIVIAKETRDPGANDRPVQPCRQLHTCKSGRKT
jgi:hypothetical protein